METKKEETGMIVLSDKISAVAVKLNNSVMSVLGQDKVMGFERAYLVSNAISELKHLLTAEYMKPIMELQGNKLGFKTDKDKDNGYPEPVVKNCLIEAVLFGLQPAGNQFNIIAGNMYATKEGMGYLLSKIPGLVYDIIPELPRIKDSSGAVVMNIEWTIGGVTKIKRIDIPVKVNNFMGTDAILGKATRKARKWLFDTITGTEIPEGDVSDLDRGGRQTIDLDKVNAEKERSRILEWIDKAETIEDIEMIEGNDISEYNVSEELKAKKDQILKGKSNE